MADNTDEEHVDSPINNQSENLPDEVIPTAEGDTITLNQETEIMEVHHHAHTARKKWTHYFWEFLMLFLAVFCGFLAEYKLEHVIENQREKEYIKSMIEDLKSDTTQTNYISRVINKNLLKVDSSLEELSGTAIISNSNKAFRLWNESRGFPDFIYTDRTIQQLKNSGSLRLIRNHAVSDSIMYFDRVVRVALIEQNLMSEYKLNHDLYYSLFNFIAFKNNIGRPVPLTETGKENLNKAYADQEYWRSQLMYYLKRIKIVNQNAKNLITFIKEQYNLD